jgi:two-component system, OmpR family, sensor kinase
MSLRIRLTLLYITLVGGILSIFGVAVYGSVSFTLLNQVDETLERTALDIIENTSANDLGVLSIVRLPALDLPTDLYVQVWGKDDVLIASSPNIRLFTSLFTSPLDPGGLESPFPVYRNVVTANVPLRVLTVPLMVGERSLGVLQVGSYIAVIEATQRTLLSVLIIGTLIAICVAGLAGWFTTNRALSPLEDVTQTALQITRADDLSHRIPYHGSPNDEVGQLINAFNQTLSRLESLFHTQRRFMADVGHELRTPLTVIKGNVGLMRRMGQTDEESLAGIENEVDRLTRLVGDLLLLAQAESGKLPLDKRLVELDTLLLEVMQQVRVLARDRLQLKLGEIDQILVCGDKDRLKQVMVNLIGNAISYTPLGGEVVVGVSKSENLARLTISDTGPGIPAEDLPHIFERFYRAEKSRTRSRDGKGFGLGLSIAYWIVNNHGGKIEVNSRVGEGTSFCVWLPLAEGNCTEEA